LKWDPKEYGTDEIVVDSKSIWHPDYIIKAR